MDYIIDDNRLARSGHSLLLRTPLHNVLKFPCLSPHCNTRHLWSCLVTADTQEVHVTVPPKSWIGVPCMNLALIRDDHVVCHEDHLHQEWDCLEYQVMLVYVAIATDQLQLQQNQDNNTGQSDDSNTEVTVSICLKQKKNIAISTSSSYPTNNNSNSNNNNNKDSNNHHHHNNKVKQRHQSVRFP